MKSTRQTEADISNKIMVDIIGLQGLLSCGMGTAKEIAEKAGATMFFGRRRLYNVEKIKAYLNQIGA